MSADDKLALVERLRSVMTAPNDTPTWVRIACDDAASALEASEAKIAALTAERDDARERMTAHEQLATRYSNERHEANRQVAALTAENATLREDSARLDWLERNRNAELAHEGWEEDVWQVHTVNGGRNDREWTLRAEGETVREAIDAACAALRQDGKP